jgi:hypothetical protein
VLIGLLPLSCAAFLEHREEHPANEAVEFLLAGGLSRRAVTIAFNVGAPPGGEAARTALPRQSIASLSL